MRTVLFLCTGNYYRSRFAEEWFNHRARELGLDWRADSAGLAEHCWTHNSGYISPFTLEQLQMLGVVPASATRRPRDAEVALLDAAHRIIAVYRKEHAPMLLRRFPKHAARVEYWDLPDINELAPARCLPNIQNEVENLLRQLD